MLTHIISHSSTNRITWDLFLAFLTIGVVLFIPLKMGFDWQLDGAMAVIESSVDYVFLFDVTLNFRTSYEVCRRERNSRTCRDNRTTDIRWLDHSSLSLALTLTVLTFTFTLVIALTLVLTLTLTLALSRTLTPTRRSGLQPPSLNAIWGVGSVSTSFPQFRFPTGDAMWVYGGWRRGRGRREQSCAPPSLSNIRPLFT